jgi:hypothetical protein
LRSDHTTLNVNFLDQQTFSRGTGFREAHLDGTGSQGEITDCGNPRHRERTLLSGEGKAALKFAENSNLKIDILLLQDLRWSRSNCQCRTLPLAGPDWRFTQYWDKLSPPFRVFELDIPPRRLR